MTRLTTQPAIDLLEAFDIDSNRGFLPSLDPVEQLPAAFSVWEELASEIPKSLICETLRQTIEKMPVLDASQLGDVRQQARAMLLLSYLAHAYVWGDLVPKDTIPAPIAIPWHTAAQSLGRPPVLSYASHALYNWRRLDRSTGIRLGNIVRLQNFLGGMDEDWFVLVHIEIEAKAAPAIVAVAKALGCLSQGDQSGLETQLNTIASVLGEMLATLKRMPEKCDPYIYYYRVRPFIFGWKDNPSLPDGVRYEGVGDYRDEPQKFRGETGAQSSIIPSIDALLGINFNDNPLMHHLRELRDYMPPKHRGFIAEVERRSTVRQFVIERRTHNRGLLDSYNACIEGLLRFRAQHLEYAGQYIHFQSQREKSNPVDVGTGGTPFMKYLKQHFDDLQSHLIR